VCLWWQIANGTGGASVPEPVTLRDPTGKKHQKHFEIANRRHGSAAPAKFLPFSFTHLFIYLAQ